MIKVKQDMSGWKMWEHGIVDSKLIVLEQVEDYVSPAGHRGAQWLCECTCSNHNKVIVLGTKLRSSKHATKSCGCLSTKINQEVKAHPRKLNNYELYLKDEHGQYGIGYCSNTGNPFYFDMEDFDKIKDVTWYEKVRKNGFRRLAGTDYRTRKQILMHVYLGYKWHDHIDKNELNNRKYNLRPATKQENARNHSRQRNNTSGITGVCLNEKTGLWMAYLAINRKNISLGRYKNKEDAIKARLQAETKYFKEFAPQRHLFEQYGILEENNE